MYYIQTKWWLRERHLAVASSPIEIHAMFMSEVFVGEYLSNNSFKTL
jgi:hypothetical protein